MKQLIPMDSYGVFCDTKDTARANSLLVAQVFGKRHDNVLADIKNLDCLRGYHEGVTSDCRPHTPETCHLWA